jgi:hypothetical protein
MPLVRAQGDIEEEILKMTVMPMRPGFVKSTRQITLLSARSPRTAPATPATVHL